MLPRYGTKMLLELLSLASLKAWMQFPRINRDWLIFAPSTILCPRFDVADALSEPARSTKESLDVLMTVFEEDSKDDV